MTTEIDDQYPTALDEDVETVTKGSSQQSAPEQVILVNKTTLNYFVIAVAFFALGVVITLIAADSLATANAAENQQLIERAVAAAFDARGETVGSDQQVGTLDPNVRVEVSADDDPAYGPETASVVMIEFSDFNCPYCGRFARETLPLVRENYGDRMRFVYRDYPILGDSSLQAAIAAECADAQGAFWRYHDLLFENQRSFNQEVFVGFAQELRLDVDQFTTCQSNSAIRDEVIADYADAQRLGASGTPTFFINGRRVVGAQPYEVFAGVIEEELASTGVTPASGTP
ncbi:MAG: DsbA family protein [Anaerolineae bacterium]|nr:DsbA family protein [Anaerolineae bacterium]